MSRERPVRSPGAAPPVTEVARQVPEDALTVAEVGEDALTKGEHGVADAQSFILFKHV